MTAHPIVLDPRLPLRAKPLRALLVPTSTLGALADEVASRHRAFSEQVAREEGVGGLFAFLLMAAPRYLNMIEHLRSDHEHLGRALAALRIKSLRASPRHLAALVAELDAIVAAIADHDEMEREMLCDALEHV